MQTMNRDRIVDAVRRYAATTTGPLTFRGLKEKTGVSVRQIYYWFPEGWFGVLSAAGLGDRASRKRPVSNHQLLVELHKVITDLGRWPRWTELQAHSRFSPATYQVRFGTMPELRAAHARWAKSRRLRPSPVALDGGGGRTGGARPEGAVKSREPHVPPTPPALRASRCSSESHPASVPLRAYSQPLLTTGALHEPTNELGVVHAFGILGARLGFSVLRLDAAFPDCEALRRVEIDGAPRWVPVRIEFEFKSRNFLAHGHDPSACDLIVCWKHDWPDCPLEVLELSPHLAQAA